LAVDVISNLAGSAEVTLTQAGSAWERVRPQRASDEIVRQFRKAVFEGRLRPGDVVGSEKQLASDFGVSRTTIRDALRSLETSGVVEIRTGVKGGTRIAQGDPLRFADNLAVQLHLVGVSRKDAIAAQLGLEWVATELAAKNATASDIDDLNNLLLEARNLIPTGVYRAASYAFHEAVARASHNWPIITTLRAVHDVLREQSTVTPEPSVASARNILKTHEAILEAIKAKEAERAAKLMRQHLDRTLDNELRKLPQT
jgi:GntR family transcriptional repressor for pyruvate dehydrogenase complex